MAPARVHLVQAALQHEGVVLRSEAAQKLPASAVEGREHVLVALDLGLQVLRKWGRSLLLNVCLVQRVKVNERVTVTAAEHQSARAYGSAGD